MTAKEKKESALNHELIDKENKIRQAANSNFEVYPGFIPSLFQIMRYRKRVAKEILENRDKNKEEELMYLWDYSNNELKKLLNI